jgi:hypothetical protein
LPQAQIQKTDEQKVAIFLTVAGQDAIDVYNTFTFTEEETVNMSRYSKSLRPIVNPRLMKHMNGLC